MSLPSAASAQAAAPVADGVSFDALLADIRTRARAGEFDRQRFISHDIIDAFKAHGIYRALVPKRFGGEECSPAEFCQLIERISHADGSAGWVASFGMSPVYLAALPLETIAKVYANGPDVVFAGGIFPPQAADLVPGGFKVKGRWKYSSGSMGAELVGVGIAPRNGDSFVPGSRVAVTVLASDPDGNVVRVEYLRGNSLLGVATVAPFSFEWPNIPAGADSLRARAVDNDGGVGESALVRLSVTVNCVANGQLYRDVWRRWPLSRSLSCCTPRVNQSIASRLG